MESPHAETKEEKEARRAEKSARKAERAEKREKKAAKAAKRSSDAGLPVESAVPPSDSKKRRRSVDAEEAAPPPSIAKAARVTALPAPGRMRTRSTDSLADALGAPAPAPAPERRPRTRSLDAVPEDEAVSSVPAGGAAAQRTAAAFIAEHSMTVKGPPGFVCPPPMESFASTPFPAAILTKFTAAGYTAPTVTQALSWPVALTGCNLVSVAKTGSGKTIGYLLPAFHGMLKDRVAKGGAGAGPAVGVRPAAGASPAFLAAGKPTLLVLAPTRELACQIEGEATKFGRAVGLRATCVYGGAPKSMQVWEGRRGGVRLYAPRGADPPPLPSLPSQIRALRSGVEVVIGTPGRLLDLLNDRCLALSDVRYLVLDEADRMLVRGGEKEREVRTPNNAPPLHCCPACPPLIRTWASRRTSAPSSRRRPRRARRCSSRPRGRAQCSGSQRSSVRGWKRGGGAAVAGGGAVRVVQQLCPPLPPAPPAAPKTVQITLGETDVLVANPSVTQVRPQPPPPPSALLWKESAPPPVPSPPCRT